MEIWDYWSYQLKMMEQEFSDSEVDTFISSLPDREYIPDLKKMIQEVKSLAIQYNFDYYWIYPRLLSWLLAGAVEYRGSKEEVHTLITNAVGYGASITAPISGIEIPSDMLIWADQEQIIGWVRKRIKSYRKELYNMRCACQFAYENIVRTAMIKDYVNLNHNREK